MEKLMFNLCMAFGVYLSILAVDRVHPIFGFVFFMVFVLMFFSYNQPPKKTKAYYRKKRLKKMKKMQLTVIKGGKK